MSVVAVIPARLDARRLPGKVLCEIGGKPMIQWVYERARKARRLAAVYVATDADAVEAACQRFGAEVIRTSSAHRSGTDRVAEAAGRLDAEAVLNVQGDEPLIEPALLDRLAALAADASVRMASAMTPLRDVAALHDPHVVKVVVDHRSDALYFSRAPIPWPGSGGTLPEDYPAYKHLGVYYFRRTALLEFAALPPAPLEQHEQLEQLRALAHGWKIRMVETAYDGLGVDTPADLEKVRKHITAYARS